MVESGKRSFLDSIPGWSGYRDRERRRESIACFASDSPETTEKSQMSWAALPPGWRRIESSNRSASLMDRMGDWKHFTDRLTTATYGYAGLFSDRPVDAKALDQIAAFDASLGDGLDQVSNAADALKNTDPDSEAFRERSEELGELDRRIAGSTRPPIRAH
ncbi:MAG: hypothetical protein R2849_13240 [Thermomicrobiales bacterium]